MSPVSTAVPAVTADVPVIVAAMLRNNLCTPRANTRRSRGSATYTLTRRTPPIVSVNRPVTSALIAPRSRNIGRRRWNAMVIMPPKRASATSVALVNLQFT